MLALAKYFLLAALLGLCSGSPTPRHVSCTGTAKPIDPAALDRYTIAFAEFKETDTRQGVETLRFETLARFAPIAAGGGDLSQLLVTVRTLEQAVNEPTVPIARVTEAWTDAWQGLGQRLISAADASIASGDDTGAASQLHRAAVALQLAETLMEHRSAKALALYKLSTTTFQRAISLPSRQYPQCSKVSIPYKDEVGQHSLPGYWCPVSPGSDTPRPTIISISGYDGSAELLFHEVAVKSISQGNNVLLVEGPGQGSAARFGDIPFRADYDVPGRQIVDYLFSYAAVDRANVSVWGRSFGGLLVARWFAGDRRVASMVADPGLYDFYQSALCSLPEDLRSLFYSGDSSAFDELIFANLPNSVDLQFIFYYGFLGFNVTSPWELLAAFEPFTMAGSMEQLAGRPMLILDAELDTKTGNQSQIFWSHLPQPLNSLTSYAEGKAADGNGLHCWIGSITAENLFVNRWLASTHKW